MPLSKQKNKERMREFRLHNKESLPFVQPKIDIPLYNPTKHKAGDKVRMSTGQIIVIPELDLDGNPIPE